MPFLRASEVYREWSRKAQCASPGELLAVADDPRCPHRVAVYLRAEAAARSGTGERPSRSERRALQYGVCTMCGEGTVPGDYCRECKEPLGE